MNAVLSQVAKRDVPPAVNIRREAYAIAMAHPRKSWARRCLKQQNRY